ncbi:MAG TPA: HAD-IA family hydrolase [Thermoanaerobaculia bacterium]|nr:HAD-IA family hydrolase [Thermoanaerobaculia bacterium]
MPAEPPATLRPPLRAVTFDVTGTLLVPRDLGRLYSEVLERHGVSIPVAAVERLFGQVLDEQRVIADAYRDPYSANPVGARGFWADVVARLLVLHGSPPATRVAVAELWERFRRADAWRVLPRVEETLHGLRDRGLRLGVIANWDQRLEEVLAAVGLLPLFAAVVRSSAVGWAKPHPAIFREALRRLGVEADQALHVGDDPLRDVEGARAVGMAALLAGGREAPLQPVVAHLVAAGGASPSR